MMNNEATHVKTQEDYSKFSSIVDVYKRQVFKNDRYGIRPDQTTFRSGKSDAAGNTRLPLE